MIAEELIQSLKICEESPTCKGCCFIDNYTEDKSCRESLIMLICIAVLNTLKTTKSIKKDHLEAVADMKKFVKERGFSLADDE
ncbi:MAG: hypothetical protein FWG14_09960 [Peptococcaceae bacterium]|nr:hypothetical protein [Peptococcaceae bacterium]